MMPHKVHPQLIKYQQDRNVWKKEEEGPLLALLLKHMLYDYVVAMSLVLRDREKWWTHASNGLTVDLFRNQEDNMGNTLLVRCRNTYKSGKNTRS